MLQQPQVIPSPPTQLFHFLYHPSEEMAPLARCRGAVLDVEINGLETQILVINVVNIVLKDLVENVLLSSKWARLLKMMEVDAVASSRIFQPCKNSL